MIDNTKNSCCVDFISARHVNCDSIVKFGESCRCDRLENNTPVMYVFGEIFEPSVSSIIDKVALLGKEGYVRRMP